MSVSAEHDSRVAAIAAAVKQRIGSKQPVHIWKGGVHHVVPLPGDTRFKSPPVDVSTLGNILAIDAAARTCTAEPGVPFSRLLEATLAEGLIPTVVPELEGITVGGAVAGCSVESMSYRHGGFHDSALEYEMIDGAGNVITCSPDKDPDAFHMVHGSYGTLGILTRLKFRLLPAKRFVRLEYRTLPSAGAFEAEMRAAIADPGIDFLDGIAHGPARWVLCIGRFVDAAPYTSSYRWLDIYYKSTATRAEDYLTTQDYCFRYDTECHWLTRTVPAMEWKAVRFAVGKFALGSTNIIGLAKTLEPIFGRRKRPDVVVDVFIPSRNFGAFCEWYAPTFDYWPLWIVPYRIPRPYPWINRDLASRMGDELFVDCAVYGKRNEEPDRDYSQLIEEKTFALDGIKTLISRNHYTAERFWQVYDKADYEAVKKRLDPHGVFPGLFEKFHKVG